jgi:hypothetical protein
LRIAELTVRKHLSPTFDRLKLTDMSSELLENHLLKVFEAGKLTARTVNSTTIDNISGGCGAGDKGKAEPAARGRNP